MQKIPFTILLLILYSASIGQKLDTTAHATDLGLKYEQKSKNGKTAGYVLLGAGLLTTISAATTMTTDLFSRNPEGEVAAGVGAIMAVGSIPIFIIANKNKRKAEQILNKQKSF